MFGREKFHAKARIVLDEHLADVSTITNEKLRKDSCDQVALMAYTCEMIGVISNDEFLEYKRKTMIAATPGLEDVFDPSFIGLNPDGKAP